jgi:hypothetical protein
VERVLGDPAFAASAQRLATAFANERAADPAVQALETLAVRVPERGVVRRPAEPSTAV